MLHYIKGDDFMDSSMSLKKLKLTAKLEKLILEGAPYEKIIKQNKILDNYVQMQFKQMNKSKEKKLVS